MSELLQPNVAMLKFSGTNCDVETAFAFEAAGGITTTVMEEDLKSGEVDLSPFQIIVFPGGFSYADDLGSGTVAALKLDSYLGEQIERAKELSLMLGVCNGFQILTRSGLLPFGTLGERSATLDTSDSGKFLSRRVNLASVALEKSRCVFMKDLEAGPMEFQVANKQGKFVASKDVISQVEANGQVVFRYVDVEQNPTQDYPENPNNSPNAIAGICDPSGRILGLMPHPERSRIRTQYPNWRRTPNLVPQGLPVVKAMIDYARQGV